MGASGYDYAKAPVDIGRWLSVKQSAERVTDRSVSLLKNSCEQPWCAPFTKQAPYRFVANVNTVSPRVDQHEPKDLFTELRLKKLLGALCPPWNKTRLSGYTRDLPGPGFKKRV